MEFCAETSLYTMHRPKDLLQTVQVNYFEFIFIGMFGCKAFVVLRMPILCSYDQIKIFLDVIQNRNYIISVWDSQTSAFEKIILNVNYNEGFHNSKVKVSILHSTNYFLQLYNRSIFAPWQEKSGKRFFWKI